ncbi:MAG: hypothetical protein Kow0069_10540 [Promethearchaeota archaeon]
MILVSIVPKYIIKKIFPLDGLSNVDVSGDGSPDHVQMVGYNVMLPISVSEMNSWNLRLEEAGSFSIDGQCCDPAKFVAYYEGKEYTMENFYEAVDLVIPVGARAKVLYPWPGGLAVGLHVIRVEYSFQDFAGEVEVTREITEDRWCLPFSPTF